MQVVPEGEPNTAKPAKLKNSRLLRKRPIFHSSLLRSSERQKKPSTLRFCRAELLLFVALSVFSIAMRYDVQPILPRTDLTTCHSYA